MLLTLLKDGLLILTGTCLRLLLHGSGLLLHHTSKAV